MERAATKCFEWLDENGWFVHSFAVFCGKGNNGGDGLAIARKLILSNKKVNVFLVSDLNKSSPEFMVNYNILINMAVDIHNVNMENNCLKKYIEVIRDADIVVDSIFGIGLNREIKGEFYSVIELINKYAKYVVSIDTPSGLNCDTGEELGISIKANETYTIETLKKGFFQGKAKGYIGNVQVVKIGIPNVVKHKDTEKIYMLSKEMYKALVPIRSAYGYKGVYGKVLVLAGSQGLTGAAYITTEAAVRTGAGLVTLLVEAEIKDLLSSRLIEAMTVTYDEDTKINSLIEKADVIICGPGLGNGSANKDMLIRCINKSKCPMVIDADGLNIIAKDEYCLKKLSGRAIFTPHLGEMSKLTNESIEKIELAKIDTCRDYSNKYDIITLLKGYNTVISNGDDVIINETGNSKMASGGMGDCLTGIIGSLVAQGVDLFNSAILGAYLHGLATDKLSNERYVVNARDVIEEMPKTIEELLTK
jgi:NAD(P)H-hydrate epimerase